MTTSNNDTYLDADVLVMGGGLAGCLAAIKAAAEAYIKSGQENPEMRHSNKWYLRIGNLECGVDVNDRLVCSERVNTGSSYMVETFECFDPWVGVDR